MNYKTPLALLVVLTLLIGTDYLSAWTAPTQVPPTANVAAPLNTATSSQVKTGGLSLNTLFVTGASMIGYDATPEANLLLDINGRVGATAYCDENGLNCRNDLQGQVVGTCPSGQAIRTINPDGTVVCQALSTTPTGSLAYGGFYVQAGSCTSGTTRSCSMTNPSCAVTNPATGACSCPAGFIARSEGSHSMVSCSRTEDSDAVCSPAAPRQTTHCYQM